MVEIEGAAKNIAKIAKGPLKALRKNLTIGQLELALLERFPREDAEEWDKMGLLVGNPTAEVTGVAVALDVTAQAIDAAQAAGANVLLTHHPAFLEAPCPISPSHEAATAPGVNVYNAIEKGVALMNFHTALDASREAARVLPNLLNLEFDRVLVPLAQNKKKGYGHLCHARKEDEPLTLSHLAARCTSVFGRPPRVWGDFELELKSVATATGSAGDVVDACLKSHVDCLVCGEVRYHAALDASQAGLCIIEVGHDASELPLAALLAKCAVEAGVDGDCVQLIDQGGNWNTPETTRL